MRIALVSDIHGNLAALEAVMLDIARRGVDRVANLGDSLSGPMLPLETARVLMAQDWIHLAGNHERQILEAAIRPERAGEADRYAHARLAAPELAWLASLPATVELAQGLLLCHGTPYSDCTALLQSAERAATREEIEARLGDVDARVVACGHSHVPRAVRTGRGQLLVNPGSVGLPAYADDFPYPHVVDNGAPDARYAILERQGGQWSAALICVPYDAQPMAALARAHGWPEVAHALLTGHMPPA